MTYVWISPLISLVGLLHSTPHAACSTPFGLGVLELSIFKVGWWAWLGTESAVWVVYQLNLETNAAVTVTRTLVDRPCVQYHLPTCVLYGVTRLLDLVASCSTVGNDLTVACKLESCSLVCMPCRIPLPEQSVAYRVIAVDYDAFVEIGLLPSQSTMFVMPSCTTWCERRSRGSIARLGGRVQTRGYWWRLAELIDDWNRRLE